MTANPAATGLEDRFQRSPLYLFLGLEFRRTGDGTVEVHLPFREELISSATQRYIHGGVIATILDVAGDYAIGTILGCGVPTIDMRVDYLRMADPAPLTASAEVVKIGRSLGIADARVRHPGGDILAIGRMLYSTSRPLPRA